MSKRPTLRNFSVSELKKSLKKLEPIMIRDFVSIYTGADLKRMGFIQLIRAIQFEHLPWLVGEFGRINTDPERVAAIAYMGPCPGKGFSAYGETFALYINDVTDGEFDRMGEER